MPLKCNPCEAVIGAEVEGIDLWQMPDSATLREAGYGDRAPLTAPCLC